MTQNDLANPGVEIKSFIDNKNLDKMMLLMTSNSYIKIRLYLIYNTKHLQGTAEIGTAIVVKSIK